MCFGTVDQTLSVFPLQALCFQGTKREIHQLAHTQLEQVEDNIVHVTVIKMHAKNVKSEMG